MKKYSIIPHTADAGITAYGETLPALFEHAAEGMFALLATPAPVGEPLERTLEIKGFDDETLLINWLNELLYLCTVEKIVPLAFRVHTLAKGFLTASVTGKQTSPGTRTLREIKAATYHNLFIQKTGQGYAVTIIFDV